MKQWIALLVMLACTAPALAQTRPLPLPPIEAHSSGSQLRIVDPLQPTAPQQPRTPSPALPATETVPPGVPTVADPLPAPHHLSLPGIPAGAQVRAMTLDDLEGIAIVNNPAIANAYAAVQAARGRWQQVGLPPNPHIGYSGVEIGDHHSAGQQGG